MGKDAAEIREIFHNRRSYAVNCFCDFMQTHQVETAYENLGSSLRIGNDALVVHHPHLLYFNVNSLNCVGLHQSRAA